jgi:hypothetical protein
LNSINRKIEKVWWSFVEKCGDGMKYLRNQNREKLNIESTGTLTRSQILYKREHGIVLIFSQKLTSSQDLCRKKKTDNKEIFEENNYLK